MNNPRWLTTLDLMVAFAAGLAAGLLLAALLDHLETIEHREARHL